MANLRVAELDFDQIKTNLKAYLNQQTEFTDYDFEGSGLSVLIDLLAYNTHYNAYLANMVINEMFLDSAVKRSSAVSIAKHLGYTPTSARSSRANIDVTVTNPTGLPTNLSMDRYTSFSTSINGTNYNFLTNQTLTTTRSGANYLFTNVELVEGRLVTFTYVVGDNTPSAKYELPDLNVDTSTLQVTIQTSVTDTTQALYSQVSDISGLTNTSKIYFLEQNPLGKYQIYFGDGVVGKLLSTGNIIIVKYIVSSGKITNVSENLTQTFSADSTIGGSNNITISVNSNSSSGADPETISSIKFNATRVNAARNRAVTVNDIQALLAANYISADDITVWGGEDNDPPYYGRVLVSLKPAEGSFISEDTKNYISSSILTNKMVAVVTPEFIDPEYIYITMTVNVDYNPSFTNLTATGMKAFITDRVEAYFDSNFNKFAKTFYTSKFTKHLLETNSSLISVTPEILLQKRFNLTLNTENSFVGSGKIKFYTKIHPNEFFSTSFYVVYEGVSTLVYLKDRSDNNPPDYNGTGAIYLTDAGSDVFLRSVGVINYSTGEITINGITPVGYPIGQTDLQLYAGLQESSYNISSVRNQILILDDSVINDPSYRRAGLIVNVSPIVE